MDESGERLIGIIGTPQPDIVRAIDTFLERYNAQVGKPGMDSWEIPVREWQRFEFLGDRVISLVVARRLYLRQDKTLSEGDMTRILGSVVSNRALDTLSRELDDAAFRRLIPHAIAEQNRYKERITGGAFEAFIGALYCEFGLESVSGFVNSLMAAALDRYDPCANPIGMLQEYYQKKGLPLPEYREAGRTGPDHGPTFTVRVETGPDASCTGSGTTLADAKQDAARTMVKKLGLLSAGNNENGRE